VLLFHNTRGNKCQFGYVIRRCLNETKRVIIILHVNSLFDVSINTCVSSLDYKIIMHCLALRAADKLDKMTNVLRWKQITSSSLNKPWRFIIRRMRRRKEILRKSEQLSVTEARNGSSKKSKLKADGGVWPTRKEKLAWTVTVWYSVNILSWHRVDITHIGK